MTGLEIALVAALVVGTAASVYGGVKSMQQQKKAAKDQERLERFRARRAKLNLRREARARRADSLALAANVGASESSSAIAGARGVTTSANSEINYVDLQSDFGTAISKQWQKSLDYQGIALIGESVSTLAGVGLTAYQGGAFSDPQSVFDRPTATSTGFGNNASMNTVRA